MAGRPEKGKRYPKGKLNQMFGGALLGQALGAAPDDMSITSTGDAQGPMPDGDTMSGPSLSAMEPMAPRRMEAIDTRSGLEKWFKPNSAGEFNNRMAYEEGANNLRLAANLAELKAKFNYENLSIDKKAKIDQMLEEMRNNNAITQQSLKAADEQAKTILGHNSAVLQTRGVPYSEAAVKELEGINPDVFRAIRARAGVEARTAESAPFQEALSAGLTASARAPQTKETVDLGKLKVDERNATVGEREVGVAEKRVPIEQQNADSTKSNAEVNKFLSRIYNLSPGSSLLRLDDSGYPTLAAESPIIEGEKAYDVKTGQPFILETGSRGKAVIPKRPVPFNPALGPQAAPESPIVAAPELADNLKPSQTPFTPGLDTTNEQMGKITGFLELMKRLNVKPTTLNPNGFNFR